MTEIVSVYLYGATTGEFVGTEEADPSPLEPGKYLVPANATLIAPPNIPEGMAARWLGAEWEVVPDHRGEEWYDPSRDYLAVIVGEIGEPAGFVNTVPEETLAARKAEAVRAERDRLLSESDKTQLPDSPFDATIWATYRQTLRDLPETEGFPYIDLPPPPA